MYNIRVPICNFKILLLISGDSSFLFEVALTSLFSISGTPLYNTGANFTTGRFNTPCAILTLADRTTPSMLGKISLISPSMYSLRFTKSSTSHTNWPSFTFCKSSFDHFDLCFPWGRYSRVHLFQIMSAYDWAVLNNFFMSWSHPMDDIKGPLAFSWRNRKWFCVRFFKSSVTYYFHLLLTTYYFQGSSLTTFKGLAFWVCSTRHMVVLSTSSVRFRTK